MESQLDFKTLSAEQLEQLGLSRDISAVVTDVKKALVENDSGKTISDKVSLIPSRERIFTACNADEGTRRKYEQDDLDQKLSSLNAFNGRVASVKIVGANALNQEKGLPRSESIIVLYDHATIRPICIMRGTEISALRTGAYAAIAGEYFMPYEKENIVGYFGTGKMAETSLLCMDATLSDRIQKIIFYSRNPENRRKFIERMQPKVRIPIVEATNPNEVQQESDYVITATISPKPLVDDPYLKRNASVLLLGGDEVGQSYLKRVAKTGLIVCDDWNMVLHRNAQSIALRHNEALNEEGGILFDESKIVNLGKIITGEFDPRGKNYESVHINCVGLAAADLEVADRMYRRALHENIGNSLAI